MLRPIIEYRPASDKPVVSSTVNIPFIGIGPNFPARSPNSHLHKVTSLQCLYIQTNNKEDSQITGTTASSLVVAVIVGIEWIIVRTNSSAQALNTGIFSLIHRQIVNMPCM